jgi:P27 family predicted phage terminase small subunit
VPAWLDERSRKYWHQISPLLEAAGVLTVLDQIALALLCKAITDYLLACEIVEAAAGEVKEDEQGKQIPAMRFVTITAQGNLIQHPGVGVMNRAWERVVKLLREFGMTPSARASIHVEGAEPEDQLMSMIREHYAGQKK